LDKEGIDQCRYVGRWLAAINVQIEVVISSPLKRASQTASLVSNEIAHEGKLVLHPALRPEATYEDFRELLEENSKRDAIMVVGHNPNFSQFLSLMISQRGADSAVELKKGAVARVDSDHRSATLQWCVTPKLVRTTQESSANSSRPKASRK
jgi:phosphohistidine phosphatase